MCPLSGAISGQIVSRNRDLSKRKCWVEWSVAHAPTQKEAVRKLGANDFMAPQGFTESASTLGDVSAMCTRCSRHAAGR